MDRPLVIGINGCQGSGKSTLADLLRLQFQHRHGLAASALSMDDFYLSRKARQRLAETVHPLLMTRGVPGTHDVALMTRTLDDLMAGATDVPLPRFDKALDDPVPEREWQTTTSPLEMLILEGWCLGTEPQEAAALRESVNRLEAEEDPDGDWRRYVNRQLAERYQPLYEKVDLWIMLKAPSFDHVYRWRLEQEQKLAQRPENGSSDNHVMTPRQLARFISLFQRLTVHSLQTLPQRVHYLYALDARRNVVSFSRPMP